mgnify:CR=1 FL=1
MTEKDLIDLGFDKFEQNDDEDRFYYYSYDLNGEGGGGSLISLANDEVEDDNWKVYTWDVHENLVFDNKEDIKIYIDVLERNIT